VQAQALVPFTSIFMKVHHPNQIFKNVKISLKQMNVHNPVCNYILKHFAQGHGMNC
jgi:hypothetical protein